MPALLALLLLSLVAAPIQDDEPKPVLSQDPLTQEQIAVYRAMLANYTKGGDVALNIANVTDPFGGDPDLAESCPKDVAAQAKPTPVHVSQLSLYRKRLLNLLGRHARRNLRVVHHLLTEIFSEAPTLSVLCEGRGPILID